MRGGDKEGRAGVENGEETGWRREKRGDGDRERIDYGKRAEAKRKK